MKRWLGSASASDPGTNPATYFYFEGWNLIQEGAGGPVAERIYVHGNRVDELVSFYDYALADWSYPHYDARGHCILLTDGSGNLIEQYDYDAFGKPYFYNGYGQALPNGSAFDNRFLFTGREWIKELKLYDYRNRLYHPELGRFLQPDPVGLQIEGAKLSAQAAGMYPAGQAPKTFSDSEFNLYSYCHNDPVNKTDPLGTDAVSNGDGTFHFIVRPDLNLSNLTGTHITHPNPRYSEQCAQGAQFLTGTVEGGKTYDAPRTRTWTRGEAIGTNTKPGTLIATGWEGGKYPSKAPSEYKQGETKNHAGVYAGEGEKPGTIKVFDQFAGKNGTMNTRTYKAEGWSVVASPKQHGDEQSRSAARATLPIPLPELRYR